MELMFSVLLITQAFTSPSEVSATRLAPWMQIGSGHACHLMDYVISYNSQMWLLSTWRAIETKIDTRYPRLYKNVKYLINAYINVLK